MPTIICIVCPRGCSIRVHGKDPDSMVVEGAGCRRGEKYAWKECTAPVRIVTTTVRICGGRHARLPVKTEQPVPKAKVRDIVCSLQEMQLRAPVAAGQTILEDAAGTGVRVIATRDMPKGEKGVV